MAPIRSIVAATLLFLSAANAHFELLKPTPLEGDNMNEDLEPNAPCGGGSADLSKNTATDFHVDGDSVTVLLAHPQADYLFRATLDTHAAGNWTQLWPIFTQSGRGNFCEPAVTAPKEWAGKKGFVGIACNAPDGILYQVGSQRAPAFPGFLLTCCWLVRRRQLRLGRQHVTGLLHQRNLRQRELQYRPGALVPRRQLELDLNHAFPEFGDLRETLGLFLW